MQELSPLSFYFFIAFMDASCLSSAVVWADSWQQLHSKTYTRRLLRIDVPITTRSGTLVSIEGH